MILNKDQLNYIKSKINYNKNNKIVRFVDNEGNTIQLENGKKYPNWVNIIHKPFYWNIFDDETIKYIEQTTNLRAKFN